VKSPWGHRLLLGFALLIVIQIGLPTRHAEAAISRSFWEKQLFTLPQEPYDEETAKLMVDRILRIEPDVLETLVYQGVRIKLVNGPITDEPEMAALKGVVPRGWENTGKTWSDIPGVGGNPVIVRIGFSEEGMGHGSYNLELHETFHAIDDYVLQGASASSAFMAAFHEEAGSLFGGNGYEELYPEEYFAEAAAMLYYSDDTRALAQTTLPKTYAFLTGILAAHEAQPPAYRALEGHWAGDALNRLAALRILQGFPDGTMRPGESVTREQYAKLLAKTLGLPIEAGSSPAGLKDVRAGSWSAPYIEALVRAAVIDDESMAAGSFRPLDPITRADMAVWTARALTLPPDASALTFADADAIAPVKHGEVGAVVANGLMNGVPGNRFAPEASVTRAEAALLLHRVLELPTAEAITSSDRA
jgi:hypothetical protein